MELLKKILGVGIIALGMALLFSLPVMWLWNWLMPEIFGVVEIDLLQALGLTVLSGLLFKAQTSKD